MKETYVNITLPGKIDPNNTSQFKSECQLYLGFDVDQEKSNPLVRAHPSLLDNFYDKCQKFLIKACNGIRERYNFDDPLLGKIKILSPKYALSNQSREITQSLSLIPLLKNVPSICSQEKYQEIDDEWRRLPSHHFENDVEELKKMGIDIFWGFILSIKNDGNEYLFKNLAECALNILSLPHSNADSERAFSKINIGKTKTRNKLIVPTMRGLVLASQHLSVKGKCVNFQPLKEMLSRMTKDSLYEKLDDENDTSNNEIDIKFE